MSKFEFNNQIDFGLHPRLDIDEGQKTLFIHAPENFFEALQNYVPIIYREIFKEARAQNWQLVAVYGDDASLDAITECENHFHIAYLDRPVSTSNLVYIMPGYLYDYWYIDPKGVRNHSSIRDMEFDPRQIDMAKANAYFANLRDRIINKNNSKWPQAERGSEIIEPNCIALITQAEKMFPYEERWVDLGDLIEATIATQGNRRVYIKPHPRAPIAEQEALLRYHHPENGVEVSVASIHDLLAQADYMVTQGSAVALEANLHQTPSILSGQTDFWQNSVVIKDANEMPRAVAEAENREFCYAAFLYWFLNENSIYTGALDHKNLWRKLAQYGCPLAVEMTN